MTVIQRPLMTWLFLIAGLFSPILATAQITLHYNDRPPYLVIKDGQLTGLTGSPATAAFRAAGIPFTLNLKPSSRQMATIKDNTGADCAVGWFKTEEREEFAKFTNPIYQDKPQIALATANNTKLKDGDTIESVFGNKGNRLLIKQGFSYGKALDGLIEKLQPTKIAANVENEQMLQLINAARADYMFVAPEEADGLIKAAGISPTDIRKINFSNAPKGGDRYILCSKKVPDEVIAKLNKAIK